MLQIRLDHTHPSNVAYIAYIPFQPSIKRRHLQTSHLNVSCSSCSYYYLSKFSSSSKFSTSEFKLSTSTEFFDTRITEPVLQDLALSFPVVVVVPVPVLVLVLVLVTVPVLVLVIQFPND